MKPILKNLCLPGVIALLAWRGLATLPAVNAVSPRPALDLELGRQAYQDHCARCHGATGAGDGRDASKVFPRPRVLTEGVFKFRTTASGTPPTDEDLFQTISEGLPGSRMPEFQRLSEETRWQLVEYIKTLSPVFKDQEPEGIPLGGDPKPKKANPERGKELYTRLGCHACHGAQGRANGPSAPTLVDLAGRPAWPADLTQGWRYRGGAAPRDILTRLMTGLDGTPMPSYAEAITLTDAWDLAYYVYSLQETPHWSRAVKTASVEGALPIDPKDPAWQKADRYDLRLAASYYRGGVILPASIQAVAVRVLSNGTEAAFLLAWHDSRENRSPPPDAFALALLIDPKAKWLLGSLQVWPPSPVQGQAAEDFSLDLTYWAADRESARQATVSALSDLADQPEAGRALPTQSSFSEGQWSVVFHRALPAAEAKLRFGMMVWDGGNGEKGLRRANSSWIDLILKAKGGDP